MRFVRNSGFRWLFSVGAIGTSGADFTIPKCFTITFCMAKPSNSLTIIGCGKAKIWSRHRRAGRIKAQDAYVGPLFKLARRFAQNGGRNWLILSAKYGLVLPDQLISDYDVTVGSPGAITTQRLLRQWQQLHPKPTVAICLASRRYVCLLRDSVPKGVAIRAPLDGMNLFKRMRWLKRHSER